MGFHSTRGTMAISIWVVALLTVVVAPVGAADLQEHHLDNGLDLLFKEAHGGPMVASIVTVGAGARFEDETSYGASHFLEHMVFNGTATRSREDINEGIKAYGGYINAMTRREYTCYILLVPREYLRQGLEIQADMLFGSLLPPDEFEKEKRVVIEEMNKDYDSGSYRGDLARGSFFLDGTPYDHPILGTVETIERLQRDQVMAYYRSRYQPGNCRLFLVGDFESEPALALVDSIFGIVPGRAAATPRRVRPMWSEEPEFRVYRAEEGTPRLDLAWLAPALRDGDYAAQLALAGMLGDEHRSPLRVDDEGGRVLELSASVEPFADFSLFTLTLDIGDQNVGELSRLLAERLAGLATWVPDAAWTAEVAHGLRVEDVFLQDTYHYYAMMKSAELHLGGYAFLAGYDASLATLSPAALRGALERSLLAGAPRVIWSGQDADSTATSIPGGPPLADFHVLPSTAQLPIPPAAAPAGALASGSPQGAGGEERLVFDNGLTVLLRSDAASQVCAAHLLIRGRSDAEPEGREGMVALAHNLLSSGTREHDEAAIAGILSSLGATLKVGDNPWIPFDDYYTRQDFSFLRLELLDESAAEGLALLAELVGDATYPDAAVDREKGRMLASLRMGSPRPSEVAREALAAWTYADGPLGRPVEGTAESIAAIDAAQLRDFHPRYFDPARMVLSVVSGLPLERLRGIVRERFGALTRPEEPLALPASALQPGPGELRHPMEDKAQVALIAARLTPPAGDLPDGLEVLVDVLSARMALELREKQGLAYSVGAGLRLVPGLAAGEHGYGQVTLQMSTGADNLEQARTGMQAELERMGAEPPSAEEVFRAVNGRWGRELMRDLSRIHQAYQLGLREHLGLDPFAGSEGRVAKQRAIPPAELAALARQYLLQDDWLWVLAGGGLQ